MASGSYSSLRASGSTPLTYEYHVWITATCDDTPVSHRGVARRPKMKRAGSKARPFTLLGLTVSLRDPADVGRLEALGPLNDLELDPLPLAQATKAIHGDRG